jgi:hypothetical protein
MLNSVNEARINCSKFGSVGKEPCNKAVDDYERLLN